MKLKFACADFTFPLLSLEQSLDLIALLEFSAVDIGLFEGRGHLWPSRELRQASKSGAALKRKLENRGLKLADVFWIPAGDYSSQSANHPDASVRRRGRDQFMRLLDFIRAAGGRHVSNLPGVTWENESYADSLARCAEEHAWRLAQARAAKIGFAIEPHLGSIISKPAQALKLIQLTPGLTLTLDCGHFISQGISSDQIKSLIPHASHFHARAAAKNRLQVALPKNTIDYTVVIAELGRTNYRGWVGFEYLWLERRRCNEVDTISEIIRLKNLLRELAAKLK